MFQLACLCLLFLLHAHSAIKAEASLMQGTICHIEGGGVGYHRGYTTAELMIMPSWLRSKNIYPFFDFRGHGFDNRKLAANVGVGFRMALPSDYCLGANLYYDVCQGSHKNFDEVGHPFSQVGLGLEAFGPHFDLRFNFYQPVGERKWRGEQIFVDDDDVTIVKVKSKKIWSVQSCDAEVGRCLDQGELACNYGGFSWRLYGAAGAYYFKHPKKGSVWGGKLRLEANLTRYLSCELRTYYDRVSNGIVQIQIGLNIPFCLGGAATECCLITSVERQEIMPLFSRSKLIPNPPATLAN